MAVLPSADSATDMPWLVLPTASVPTSFGSCWKARIGASFWRTPVAIDRENRRSTPSESRVSGAGNTTG
jgi:hypothetical protein